MQTSNFAKSGNDPKAIAISEITPGWYHGRVYPPLFPPRNLIRNYKRGLISKEDYTMWYYKKVLARQDPYDVVDMVGEDAILLCWEGADKFCHRRIVAGWLEAGLSISIPEVALQKKKYRRVILHKGPLPACQATLF